MTGRCEAWRYSFLEEAAEESRNASRRYWAAGGPADRKYPKHPMPGWPDTPPPIDEELAKRRRRRIQHGR
jgi:hypothetical protein